MSKNKIIVKGAREHNLKNIDVEIPKESLTVITGLSGSGKSSFAFDTIYAEGQRRYVESLSAYARQFLEIQKKPDVDSIEGLNPAISIDQKTTSKNPRSTVGTITEIYDYMRLLFARVGVPYSPATDLPIENLTTSQITDIIANLEHGTKIIISSPIANNKKGEFKKELAQFVKQGFQRFKIDGEIYEQSELPDLNKNYKHNIDVIIDRLIIKEGIETRLSQSVETALKLSDGNIYVENISEPEKSRLYSTNFSCPESGFSLTEIEPRMFSFNNPNGACDDCGGLGTNFEFSEDLIIDENLSINNGAITPWHEKSTKVYIQTFESLAKHYGFSLDTPWQDICSKVRKKIVYGTKDQIEFKFDDGYKIHKRKTDFEGIIPSLARKQRETRSISERESINKYKVKANCTGCNGHRLKMESLCVKIDDLNISEVSNFNIKKLLEWTKNLENKLSPKQKEISIKIINEIENRLSFLINVGLDYITIARSSATLSGGESQRIRLASQIGSGLTGVIYVLDEPSIGLHQRDNERLLKTLVDLRDKGNTVIVVEHDEDAIKLSDYLIDIGPGAGINGGNVIAQGSPEQVFKNENSITAQYINGIKKIEPPKKRRKGTGEFLKLYGAKSNNLKNVDIQIPVGTLSCITGVSGSGKSTLIIETLQKEISNRLMGTKNKVANFDKIEGVENFNKIIIINQSPIGRTPRSNPATYTGAFTLIRDWFVNLPESKARGYTLGRFSFNVKGGRCETCNGDGVLKIEMHFLPDLYITCDECKGKRYNKESLEIKYKDKSISDVLEMSIDEAAEFFKNVPLIHEKMATLQEVGLGYIKVGQQATTLSGGEAQRIKLAKELSKKATGKTLYILDEPTTGLHFEDINKLMKVIQKLVDQNNTIIIIEHNLDVIKCADYIIDMGPEGGDKGGMVIGFGTPEDIVKIKESHTGKFLKELLNKK